MSVYDIDGNPIATDGEFLETPYLSSSAKNRLKEQSDFDMSSFDIIKVFTPFSTDYSTNTSTPRVLDITQQQFYDTFYEPYLGYHDDLLVTKKNLGKDQSGTYDIWCYDFIPYNAKRKIMLSSGMHTYELPASFGLALWIKNYMESSDAVFQYMRQNVQISVIPIVNPWGFNQTPQKKYGNSNGVNPNRNFNNWGNIWATFPDYSPNPSASNYNEWNVKGNAPFSEAETKILCNWAKNNTDADFWIDCHTGLNNSRASFGDVWYVVISDNVNLTKIQSAASALMTHLQTTYNKTPKLHAVVDADSSIRQRYSDAVIGLPTMTIEQPQYSDTVYATVPNNCPTAIIEYATNIHAYIVAQLQ
jgi:hypothetical protein